MKKRIPPRLAAEYPPVLLWLDDLEEMETLLKGWASTVKFKTESAEYDSLAELKSDVKEDEMSGLEIECSSPYASVELLKYKARIYVSAAETPTNAGVFHSLDGLLKRRVRKFLRVFIHIGFYFAVLAPVLIVALWTRLLWISLLSLVFCLMWSVVRMRHWYSLIKLEHRGSSRSYWKRNKDNILTTVLTGAITALIAGAIGYFFGQQRIQSQPSAPSDKPQASPLVSLATPSPTATRPP